ncbi:muscarinic acetylcholine receptor M4-like [Ruditapes philippinarum]|uniref:muscarinic acetylcholine receptor M4-like n=1 Tax=Ruditapes philippinarum TaxID=129788 RepID=UPI00295BF51A|nr:muscarinic acetylcholine receptor M4-like [Ruditapes philippinarum]
MESRYIGSGEAIDISRNVSLNVSKTNDDDFLETINNEIFLTKIPAVVYTSVMMILGLPGNITVFYIYFFKWRRSTSRIFILFLAALDTLNCSTTLPMEIYLMRYSVNLDQPLLCKLSRFSTYVMNSASALVLVGIAADRFKRICRPYQRAFSEAQSRYISIGAILFSMATTWPSLFLYGTRRVKLGNVTGSSCLLQNEYDSSPYPLIYFSFMITTTMLTFVILIILYYLVGLQIYRHRRFKLKNCTHVQQIVDEKTITAKSEKSNGEKLKSSNNELNNVEEEDCAHDKVVVVVKAESVVQNDDDENELKPYQLGLPPPCKDVGTSCGLLDIPYQQGGQLGSDFNLSEITRATSEHSLEGLKVNELPEPKKAPSPKRKIQKVKEKKKRRRVRYLLVRGSSTLNASGRAKCVNCLTVRIGRSTLMLFFITIAFVISFMPFYVLVIIRQSNSNFVRGMSKSGLTAFHLFLRSYLLSSAVNPFIYSFCNAQFRGYCKETFSRIFIKRHHSFMNHSSRLRRRH